MPFPRHCDIWVGRNHVMVPPVLKFPSYFRHEFYISANKCLSLICLFGKEIYLLPSVEQLLTKHLYSWWARTRWTWWAPHLDLPLPTALDSGFPPFQLPDMPCLLPTLHTADDRSNQYDRDHQPPICHQICGSQKRVSLGLLDNKLSFFWPHDLLLKSAGKAKSHFPP